MIRWSEFAYLCEQELELCAVREGETVVVLSQATDRLDYRATIDDPQVFTRPWTIAFTNRRVQGPLELMEYAGVEGESSIVTFLGK